ncbi:MAG TPA: hypothetical protein VMT52_19820 [Planctomycetota bacterium]|nr:hypothetical protein [Planctomycetota bacterium]
MCFPEARRRLQALSAFTVVSSVLILAGCTPASPKGKGPESPPPKGAQAASPAPSKESGATPAEGERGEIPQAVKDLKEKLQPPGAALTATPPQPGVSPRDDAALVLAAEKLASSLVEALREGDTAAAEGLTLSEEQFAQVVSPGHRDILAGHIPPQNKAVIQTLGQTLKGKNVQHTFKPGPIEVNRPGSAFVGLLPIMTQAVIVMDLEGVQLQVQLDHILYIDDQWKIFRLRAL